LTSSSSETSKARFSLRVATAPVVRAIAAGSATSRSVKAVLTGPRSILVKLGLFVIDVMTWLANVMIAGTDFGIASTANVLATLGFFI
jgi:hypothetical protein